MSVNNETVLDKSDEQEAANDDICGLCGLTGADKIRHPAHWPGERCPETMLVHRECEEAECSRAHAQLSDKEREAYLRSMPM